MNKVRLQNITLQFPAVTELSKFKNEELDYYQNQFVFNKKNKADMVQLNLVKKAIDELIVDEEGISPTNICLKDGDTLKTKDGAPNKHTEGKWILKTKNYKPIPVRSAEGEAITSKDEINRLFTHNSKVNIYVTFKVTENYSHVKYVKGTLWAMKIIETATGVTEDELVAL